MTHQKLFKRIGIGALFLGILLISFWIRIQGGERLYMDVGDEKVGRFTENDAYLYHEQAKEIATRGILPVRDMRRWLPLGRDNRQLLSLYAHAIAYTHKAFPWFSLYHIQLYAPILCFAIGLCVLLFFFARSHGVIFATIVGLLLATLPGSVERSAIGFGDRDAWCWLWGVLAVTSYLWKEQIEHGPRRWIVTAVAGFTVFLGGLSWEGFGFFVLIILCAELWKFCTTDTEHRLKEYILWLLMFVPLLYLMSPAYRSGYGFSTHVSALMLLPSLTVFALRGIRYLLLRHVEHIRDHAQKIAVGLTIFGIVLGGCYIFSQFDTFETTAFAFQESRLMKDVGELMDPHFEYWTLRYGVIFVLGSIGLITLCFYLWQRDGIPQAVALSIFTATTFFREPVGKWISADLCDTLFLVSLILTVLWFGIATLRKTPAKNELIAIAVIAWFILWVGLARGSKRYDFFIGLPLAYGTAWALWTAPSYFIQKLSLQRMHQWISAGFTLAVLVSVFFFAPLGGHALRAIPASAKWRAPVPILGSTARTILLMKDGLPRDAVVAASWEYGTQLNSLSNVKTITDSDHFLPHWVHLYYRHVYCAQDEEEALSYLKTHNATHLMLTPRDVFKKANAYSFIGSNENNDRSFGVIPLKVTPSQHLSKLEHTPFDHVGFFDLAVGTPKYLSARLKNGSNVMIPYVAFINFHYITSSPESAQDQYGGFLLYFNIQQKLYEVYYIPPIGWNSLAVRLFYRNKHSNAFTRVHPRDLGISTKVWEIRYPPHIKKDSKYLVTAPRSSHEK